MLRKIWKLLNAPIVIVAIIGCGIYFLIRPRVYYPLESLAEQSRQETWAYREIGGTYFGYAAGNKYSSTVSADDVLAAPQWDPSLGDPPLSPSDAIAAIRSSLSDLIPELSGLAVASVNLTEVSSERHYIYIVEFQPTGRRRGVGLRLIALMDGTVIRPKVTENEPDA